MGGEMRVIIVAQWPGRAPSVAWAPTYADGMAIAEGLIVDGADRVSVASVVTTLQQVAK